jgi:hypothetical protein
VKPHHKTAAASFVRSLLHILSPSMPICVCMTCVLPTDEVIATAGDFSLCDRCRASITSKTGLAVRLRQPKGGTVTEVTPSPCESKGHVQLPIHSCPYATDVNNDPSDHCTCCKECEQLCQEEI